MNLLWDKALVIRVMVICVPIAWVSANQVKWPLIAKKTSIINLYLESFGWGGDDGTGLGYWAVPGHQRRWEWRKNIDLIPQPMLLRPPWIKCLRPHFGANHRKTRGAHLKLQERAKEALIGAADDGQREKVVGHQGAESWIWGEGHWCPERFASHPIHHPPPAPLGLHTPFFSRPNQPQQRPNFCWNCDSAIIRRWRPQSQTTLGTGGGKVCTADRFIDIVWQQLAEEWLIGHQKTDRRPLSRRGGVWG